MSKKFSAAALIAITASPGPATGSGTSARTRSSGWQYCEQRMAFMAAPWVFRVEIIVCPFLPDLGTGDNPVSLFGQSEGLSSRHCERSEAIQTISAVRFLDCFAALATTN